MVALLVILTILIFLTVDLFLQRAEARRREQKVVPSPVPVHGSPDSRLPGGGLWLDQTHSWLLPEADGNVRVGADWLATAMLGHPESIHALTPGTRVRRGEPVVTLRNDERELSLAAPVDGTVVSVNDEAKQDPRLMEHDPFGRGWLYRVRPVLSGQTDGMRTGEEAVAWMRSELSRLRDCVLSSLPADDPVGVTLQDGGFPVRGVARLVDDEDWRKLVESFFVPGGCEESSWLAEALSSDSDTLPAGAGR